MEKNDPKNEGIHPKALLITEDRTPKGVLSGTSSHLSTVPSSTLAYSFRSSKASSVSSLNVILTFSGTILKKGDASRRVLSSLLSGMSMLGAFAILPPFSVLHTYRLSCVLQYVSPKSSFRIDMVTLRHCSFNRNIYKPIVYTGCYALCLSSHGGVYCMGAETGTVNGIVTVCSCTSYDIGRINVFYRYRNTLLFEVFFDLILQKYSYILILDVSSCVHFPCRWNKVGTCAFSNKDDGVPPIHKPLFKVVQETVGTFKVKG